VPVPGLRTDNSLGLDVSLTPDGTGVLLVHSQGSGTEADPNVRLTTIDRYTLDGQLVGSVPLDIGDVRWATVSADGATVAALQAPESGPSAITIISTTDGSIISRFESAAVAPIIWADSEVLVTTTQAVFTVDGQLARYLPPPTGLIYGPTFQSVVLAPSDGLPPAAASLGF
jgi:hypothetical protein